MGQTIHIAMAFPPQGGIIEGAISGACQGTIVGSYTGELHGKVIEAKALPICSFGFISLHVMGSLKGRVNRDDTQADISYTVSINGTPYAGIYQFPLSLQK